MDVQGERTVAEYQRACRELDAYLARATRAQLKAHSDGTRWSNEELLFHMVFGYMVVRALVPLVKMIGRLPEPWRRALARALNVSTVPFDVVNFWGSRAAALVFNRKRMARRMLATTRKLAAALEGESPASLARSMDFPNRWDPFFRPSMTLADVYAYPTLHFDFHGKQLSLGAEG
ncbi:DinB family protein [Arthrobacter sp.]|jgi:hypothetical protein|uniref:DinB family protein n=1 Tax=Arthrobacter sp. TaxID=1667 RepID=UPI00258E6378|nr:DinB family protein [Arthrobacter sp.]